MLFCRECLKDSLETTTSRDYRKYPIPKGSEPLPHQTLMYVPGREFGRDLLRTLPTSQQVYITIVEHPAERPIPFNTKHLVITP